MDFLKTWRGRRVLVTGGSGFIGQHVIGFAREAGIEIHNATLGGGAIVGAHTHQVDLRERERVFALLSETQPCAIIHLAASGASRARREFSMMLQANAIGTENLLAAASALAIRPIIVMAGSGLEYTPQNRPYRETDPAAPLSAYGAAKAAAALCAHFYSSRLPITLLRLFDVYGPGDSPPRLLPYIVARSKRGEMVELTGCEQVRDYTYVQDIAESFWRGLALPPASRPHILNVGTGLPIRLRTLIETMAAVLRKKGLTPELAFGRLPYRTDEPMLYAANIERMQKAFGWTPTIGLAEGLKRTIDAML